LARKSGMLNRSWDYTRLAGALGAGGKPEFPRKRFVLLFAATVLLWLTEPLHGVPSGAVALAAAVAIFALKVLPGGDIKRLDWSTLLLIAGGISLGRLLELSGIVSSIAMNIPFGRMHPALTLFILCLTSATLSALM